VRGNEPPDGVMDWQENLLFFFFVEGKLGNIIVSPHMPNEKKKKKKGKLGEKEK
jgi:hypothetical protein